MSFSVLWKASWPHDLGLENAISKWEVTWWRHQMETFYALLAICAGNSAVPGEFPAQRPVTRSFDVFLNLRLNKRLSKQSWGWWFETPSNPLWRHRNDIGNVYWPNWLRYSDKPQVNPKHTLCFCCIISAKDVCGIYTRIIAIKC